MSQVKRNLQQQRAAFALTTVQKVKSTSPSGIQKRFKAYSNSLPAMIQMNGIGQALAFAYQKSNGSKDENIGWSLLFNAVSDWLLNKREIWGKNNAANILNVLSEGGQEQYQLAQAEAQALLSWMKDFSRAEIAGDAEGD